VGSASEWKAVTGTAPAPSPHACSSVESCALKDFDHCWYGGRSGGFASCEKRAGDIDATSHMFDSWEAL